MLVHRPADAHCAPLQSILLQFTFIIEETIQKNKSGEGLIETVQQLLAQPGKLAEMGANAKTLGNPHSLELITAKLLELVK